MEEIKNSISNQTLVYRVPDVKPGNVWYVNDDLIEGVKPPENKQSKDQGITSCLDNCWEYFNIIPT